MKVVDAVPLDDRGFAYGDGVFETMPQRDGVLLGLERHLLRLRLGCERLGFEAPARTQIDAALAPLRARAGRAVVKLVATRGRGGRGYRPSSRPQPAVYASSHAWPDELDAQRSRGIEAKVLQARLVDNPSLAGFKHLNRLEQVLASIELARTPGVHEGLVTGTDGRVVCAVMANLFLVLGGQLVTPCLRRCGVDGIIRAAILDLSHEGRLPPVTVRDVGVDEIEGASEVFLTNSVRGLLPVRRVASSRFPVDGPLLAACRAALERLELLA